MELSIKNHFTLIPDEFQEFYNINPSVYGEMQKYWDLYKEKSKIDLIVCGSIYSLMHKISKMLDYIISEDSPFITDGKNMLIDEFGKDYAIYFTILSFIANGYNTRSVIEASIDKEVGGYLTRLENDYGLIEKKSHLFSKNESKNVSYSVKDNFLTFWFRFILYINLVPQPPVRN